RLYRWRLPALRAALAEFLDRKLWMAVAVLVGVLVFGTAALASIEGMPLWDAIYVVVLTAVGGAEPGDVDTLTGLEQFATILVTLTGLALVPVVTATMVEAAVQARLAVALGRLRQPVADHVVVIGLGNVGTRVMRGLHEFGVPVVAIDRVPTARGADLARRLGIPLIIGDAADEATLRAASVQTCRALVVLSTDDNVNLEATLSGRELKPDLRVVLRLFNGDFARRVQRAFGVTASHSVSYVAAPSFAAAMMEREVLTTIPVGRRVLLIAEVSVAPGSDFDGRRVGSVDVTGMLRVLALYPRGERFPTWTPPRGQRIRPYDRLIIVATRAGLAHAVERSTPMETAPGPGGAQPARIPEPR
ncbi:MAG: NAD-binding protein, partial [Dactylosporangium sp.]|nr:NAD-binding protein [Dactylosporangium sp.]